MPETLIHNDHNEPALVCDSNIPGGNIEAVEQMFSNIAGDACFYGCFVASLYSSATTRYSSVQQSMAATFQSVLNLGKVILRQPELFASESIEYIESMVVDFEAFISGTIGQIADAAKQQSFSDIMWSMVKTMVCRYGETILLAAIQGMVNKLKDDLHNRSIILGNIRNLLVTMESDVNDMSETDWWREFVRAVIAADLNLKVAEQEVYRAHSEAIYGRWDSSRLETAQWRIATAIQKLAPRGLVGDLLDMFSDVMKGRGFDPFDPAFFRTQVVGVLDSIERLGSTMADLKKWYNCLLKTTVRIKYYKDLIVASEKALEFLQSNQSIGLALDVLMTDNTLWYVGTRLGGIRADMHDVVLNNRRTTAPVNSAAWRNELQGLFFVLKTLGNIPQPFGVGSHVTNQQAADDLAYIIHPHNPSDGILSLSENNFGVAEVQQILANLLNNMGNISTFFTRHAQWSFEFNRIRTDINAAKNKDDQTVNMLNRFSGYEDQKFDYVISILQNAGWTAAKKMLESGFINGFLNMSIAAVVSGSTLFQCLSGVLSNMGDDDIPPEATEGLKRVVEELQGRETSYSLARARSATMLPALQFQVLGGLQRQLEQLQGDINTAINIAGTVC